MNAGLKHLKMEQIEKQRSLLHKEPPGLSGVPLERVQTKSPSLLEQGEALLRAGKVGVVLLAGGQGTRLGFAGPKGLYPVTPVKKKPAFQFFSEKIAAASEVNGKEIPLAVMVSEENAEATREAFVSHDFWGLSENQVDFFIQESLPFLTKEGEPLHRLDGTLLTGPSGNGEVFHSLYKSEVGKKWEDAGIEVLNLLLIDNLLADPVDSALIGLLGKGCEVAVKTIERLDEAESLGLLMEEKGKLFVKEYSEVDPKEMKRRRADGKLLYLYANLSLFACTMDAAKEASQVELPLHKAYKTLPENREAVTKGWKFETFIFDLFEHFQCEVLLYEREETFSPLKNRDGPSSPETVARDLTDQTKRLLRDWTGEDFSLAQELDPRLFYLKERPPLTDSEFIAE